MYDLRRACDAVPLVVSGHCVNHSVISEDIAVLTGDGIHMPKTGQLCPSPGLSTSNMHEKK